jgi:TP901 family phage tail tape measure protein
MPSTPPIKVPILGVDLYSKEFKQMTKRAKQMGRAVEGVGRKATGMVTLPLLAAGGASVKFAKDLNQSMANVGTLIPGQTKRLVGMKEAVQDLSVETGVSAMTISQGLYDTISAFGDAEDPINKLTIATKMSKAGLSDVREALGLVSAVTKGYGDTSDAAAQKASDLAFMTVKLGQTTFPDLAASMGKVVPLAATLKVSQEDLFGAMATLTGVTGNAAEVSTQLRSVLGAMIKPSADMTKAAKKLGYESAVAMVEEEGLSGSIQKLGEYTGGSTEKLGKMITRKEGLTAALALLGGQSDTFAQKTKAMGDVAGATDEAFNEMTGGINKDGHAMDQSRQRVEKAAVALGDKLLPVVVKLTDKLVPLIDRIADADEETLEWGIKIAAGAAAVGPLLIGIGKMIQIYPTAAKLTSLWTAKMAASRTATVASTIATTKLNTITMASNQTLKGTVAANNSAALSQRNINRAVRTSNVTLGQSIKQAGRLNSTMSVLAAGAFGWEIGTLIYDNVVGPLQNARAEADQLFEELNMGTKYDSDEGLKKKKQKLQGVIATEKGSWFGSDKQVEWAQTEIRNIDTQLAINKMKRAEDVTNWAAAESASGTSKFDEAALAGAFEKSRSVLEGNINITFDGLPDGVTPNVTRKSGGNVNVKNGGRGAVLPAGGM